MHTDTCPASHGQEWSGSPCLNDTAWECDHCGAIIPATAEDDTAAD